ncbi:MAG: transglutaminase-like domain-containing protein [Anaerovoracaceae bacterium]|jgi:transglutaminase-like putative cysteine protease
MSTVVNIRKSEVEKTGTALPEILLCVLLSLGFFATLFSMFRNPMGNILTLCLVVTLPVLMYFLVKWPAAGKYVMFYTPAIVAVYGIVFHKSMWNGMMVVVNALLERVNEESHGGYVPFEIVGGESSKAAQAAMFLVPLIMLIAAAIAHSVERKEPGVAFFFLMTPLVAALLLKGTPALLPFFLLISAMIWLFIHSLDKVRKQGRLLPLLILAPLVLIFLVYALVFPVAGYTPGEGIQQAREALISGEEMLRYGGNGIAGLAEGDLTKTQSIQYTEEPVLKLKLEKPTVIHLRGFVGSSYKEQRWQEEKSGAYGKPYIGISKWLDDRGIRPQAQMNNLFRMDPEFEFANVEVEVLKASRKYMYTPYEVATVGDLSPEKANYSKDTTIRSRGLLGKKKYQYKVFVPSLGEYNSANAEAWVAGVSDAQAFASFSEAEKVYRKFVYDTYLDVPKSEQKNLETLGVDKVRGKTADFAIFFLREVFTKNYEYDPAYKGAPKGKDELAYFVNKSRTGNDMHFATVATLYLREAGIPARYVEGYYLSKEYMLFFEDMNNLDLDVPDSLNHAWVEIYVDNIGWQPIEVIPGYYNVEKEAVDSKEDADKEKEIDQKTYPDEIDVQVPGEEESGAAPKNPLVDVLKILLPTLLALLAVITGFQAIGRYRLRKRKTLFAQEGRSSVGEMYKYIGSLMKFGGLEIRKNAVGAIKGAGEKYDGMTSKGYEEILDLVYKARFSKEGLRPQEHGEVLVYTEELAIGIYQKMSPLKKFIMRRIRFLY